MTIDPNKIVDLIKDKKEILIKILEIIDRNHKQAEGCKKLRESLTRKEEPNHSIPNLIRCTEVALAASAKNSEDLMTLSQLILVYTQGSNFTVDVATLAGKLGKTNEALRAMMDTKLRGE